MKTINVQEVYFDDSSDVTVTPVQKDCPLDDLTEKEWKELLVNEEIVSGAQFSCVNGGQMCVYFKDVIAGHTNNIRCKF